ncbi:MAG: hypothetical protein ACRENC_12720 [Gemmatimonadaceae bacterium]
MPRLLRAFALSIGAALVLLGLLRYVLLPDLAAHLNDPQAAGVRDILRAHPYLMLLVVLGVAAVLSLPVLLIGLWGIQAGPFRPRPPRR